MNNYPYSLLGAKNTTVNKTDVASTTLSPVRFLCLETCQLLGENFLTPSKAEKFKLKQG